MGKTPVPFIQILCFFIIASLIGACQAPTANSIAAKYSDTSDGLKLLVQDVFAAVNSGDIQKSSALLASLSLPNHQEWFSKTFGSHAEPFLDYKYEGIQPESNQSLKDRIEEAVKNGDNDIIVRVLQNPTDASALVRPVLEGMVSPTPLFEVTAHLAGSGSSGVFIGDFVFVDHGFRYLDWQVFLGFASDNPMRITVPEALQIKKLVHRVEPIYPPVGQRKMEGKVHLQAVLGRDGRIQQIWDLNGDPILFQSAINAVKQWQYQPTVLGGTPFYVVTSITVDFRLKK